MPEEIPWNSSVFPERANLPAPGVPSISPFEHQPLSRATQSPTGVQPPAAPVASRIPTQPLHTPQEQMPPPPRTTRPITARIPPQPWPTLQPQMPVQEQITNPRPIPPRATRPITAVPFIPTPPSSQIGLVQQPRATRPISAMPTQSTYPYPTTPPPATVLPRPAHASWSKRLLAAILSILAVALLSGGTYIIYQHVLAAAGRIDQPYSPYGGTLVLGDSLKNNGLGYKWEEDSDRMGNCAFDKGTYHARATQRSYLEYCRAQSLTLTNFAIQVKMAITSGERGGIVFRCNQTEGYFFNVDREGFYRLVAFTQTNFIRLMSGSSPEIKKSQTYLLAVVARNNKLDLYVNQIKIASTNDKTFKSGEIALAAQDITQSADATFSNVEIWQL